MAGQRNGDLNVVICAPILGSDLEPVRAAAPGASIIDGNREWDAFQRAQRGSDEAARAEASRALDAVLQQADVFCMAFPALRDPVARAPRLRWLHHTQAGVSNLYNCDVWHAEDVLLTSGRGHVRPTAMAEYTIAGALLFARGLHDGYLDKPAGKLDRAHYQPLRIAGSTMGVVGLGGIGKEVARLAKALGMRVVATRRSVTEPRQNVDHSDELLPADRIADLARQSDFIAVCTQLTRETEHLIGRDVLGAAEKRPVLINISRGETIDELALLEAIEAGRVRGAVLDVYEGEMEGRPPRPELMASPHVVLTPHISNGGAAPGNEVLDLFCENLRRYVRGEDLLNVVDRARGY